MASKEEKENLSKPAPTPTILVYMFLNTSNLPIKQRKDSVAYYGKVPTMKMSPETMFESALTLQFLTSEFTALNNWLYSLVARPESGSSDDHVDRSLNRLRLLNVAEDKDFAMRIEYMVQTMMLTMPQKDPPLAYWLATNAWELVDEETSAPIGIVFLEARIAARLKEAQDYYLWNAGDADDCPVFALHPEPHTFYGRTVNFRHAYPLVLYMTHMRYTQDFDLMRAAFVKTLSLKPETTVLRILFDGVLSFNRADFTQRMLAVGFFYDFASAILQYVSAFSLLTFEPTQIEALCNLISQGEVALTRLRGQVTTDPIALSLSLQVLTHTLEKLKNALQKASPHFKRLLA